MTNAPRIRTLPTTTPDIADLWLAEQDREFEEMMIEANYDPDLPYGPMMEQMP